MGWFLKLGVTTEQPDLAGLGQHIQETVCALSQPPIGGCASPIDKICGTVIRGGNG